MVERYSCGSVLTSSCSHGGLSAMSDEIEITDEDLRDVIDRNEIDEGPISVYIGTPYGTGWVDVDREIVERYIRPLVLQYQIDDKETGDE